MKSFSAILLLAVTFVIFSSCKRDRVYEGNSPILSFSEDTLTFDTVFTSLGTITRYFKVENTSNSDVRLDKIQLAGLHGSTFRLNIDGVAGNDLENVIIPAKDYIYIFAEATIDPNNQNNPFILIEEIQYFYNQIEQKSYLRAWGQNAYFHYGEIIEGDSIWQNDKPHVVIRNDSFPGVGVEAFGSLTILPGCKVYFSQNSGIFSDGPVTIGMPNCTDSVILQTDRVEDLPNGFEYFDKGGLWLGIIMRNNAVANLHNVCIKNATYGIMGRWLFDDYSTFTISNAPTIHLENVQIVYSSNSSIFGLNAKITASNSIFHESDQSLATLALGGEYQFENCTFNHSGQDEAIILSNFASNGAQGAYGDLNQADFINCIVYGGKIDELLLNNESNADFNFLFTNSLLKTSLNTDTIGYVDCIINQNPMYDSEAPYLFYLDSNSPCLAAGTSSSSILDYYCRPHNSPKDIGAVAF